MDHITECPSCHAQVVVKLSFASAPRKSTQSSPSVSTDNLEELLDSIDMTSLDEMSFDFVNKTKARFEQYGTKTIMSDKQMAWLRKLASGISGAF